MPALVSPSFLRQHQAGHSLVVHFIHLLLDCGWRKGFRLLRRADAGGLVRRVERTVLILAQELFTGVILAPAIVQDEEVAAAV